MGHTRLGADPDALDALARRFHEAGRRVDALQDEIERLIAAATWHGADADALDAELRGPLTRATRAAATRLATAGDELDGQARQQREASDADEAHPGSPTPTDRPDLAPPGTEADRERRHGSARVARGTVWDVVGRLPYLATGVGALTLLGHLQQWLDLSRRHGVDDPRTRAALRQVGYDCIDTGTGAWKTAHVQAVLAVIAYFYGPELPDLADPSTWLTAVDGTD